MKNIYSSLYEKIDHFLALAETPEEKLQQRREYNRDWTREYSREIAQNMKEKGLNNPNDPDYIAWKEKKKQYNIRNRDKLREMKNNSNIEGPFIPLRQKIEGLLIHLRQRIATVRSTAKQTVMDKLKKQNRSSPTQEELNYISNALKSTEPFSQFKANVSKLLPQLTDPSKQVDSIKKLIEEGESLLITPNDTNMVIDGRSTRGQTLIAVVYLIVKELRTILLSLNA